MEIDAVTHKTAIKFPLAKPLKKNPARTPEKVGDEATVRKKAS